MLQPDLAGVDCQVVVVDVSPYLVGVKVIKGAAPFVRLCNQIFRF